MKNSGVDSTSSPDLSPSLSRLGSDAREAIESLCVIVPDVPAPGVMFRDLTPVFADAAAFRLVVDAIAEPFTGQFDAVAGVEARGFLLAGAVAYATGTGLVAIRKEGKLPRSVYREAYDLEYGQAALEIHTSDLPAGARVLVLDDVLATGGTLAAACALLERTGAVVVGCGVVLEISELAGRAPLTGRTLLALDTV